MMSNINPGDIFHFDEYFFTDTGEQRNHFALLLLPPTIFVANAHFCVITSRQPKGRLYLELIRSKYKCFSEDCSYARFDKVDLERVDDSGTKKRGTLTLDDLKRGVKIIHKCLGIDHLCYQDRFFRAAIIRAWIRRKAQLSGNCGATSSGV